MAVSRVWRGSGEIWSTFDFSRHTAHPLIAIRLQSDDLYGEVFATKALFARFIESRGITPGNDELCRIGAQLIREAFIAIPIH